MKFNRTTLKQIKSIVKQSVYYTEPILLVHDATVQPYWFYVFYWIVKKDRTVEFPVWRNGLYYEKPTFETFWTDLLQQGDFINYLENMEGFLTVAPHIVQTSFDKNPNRFIRLRD